MSLVGHIVSCCSNLLSDLRRLICLEIAVDSMDLFDVNVVGGGVELSVPVVVIKAGVYNGALRDGDAIRKSAPLWEGMPIIQTKVEGIDDHPPEKIVTCRKQIVGQVRNPVWSEEEGKIRAEAWFSDELGSPPEIMRFLEGGGKLGVSGAYFHETLNEEGEFEGVKYSARFYDLVPNNLAIVMYPACPVGTCGINVESFNNSEVKKMTSEMAIDMEELVSLRTESATAKVAAAESEKVKKELGEKVVKVEAEKAKIAAEMDEMAVKLAEVTAERDALKAKVDEAAVEAKKQEFLGKFPAENRAAAESELLGVYMEDPAKFVIEHGNRYAELLVGKGPQQLGKEFVPEPDVESQEWKAMGFPTEKEIAGMFGIEVKE